MKERTSAASKLLWQNPEYRAKVIAGTSKPRRQSFKQEQSKRTTEWYRANPDQRQLRADKMKESWRLGKLVKGTIASSNKSKMQEKFFSDLKDVYSGVVEDHVVKTQDNKWKFPDAIELRDGVIIEFYGDYWHANPKKYSAEDIAHHKIMAKQIWENDRKRVDELTRCGFTVLVIWESDYKYDKGQVMKKIDSYVNWESCSI